MHARFSSLAVTAALAMGWLAPAAIAQEARAPHRSGEILVRFKESVGEGAARGLLQGHGARVKKRLRFDRTPSADVNRFYQVDVPAGMDVEKALALFSKVPGVDAVQPNYLKHKVGAPTDPSYTNGNLWGLNNTGQAGRRGTLTPVADADIDWLEAWNLIDANPTPTDQVIVAVIDTGVNYAHPDLAPVMWVNPAGAADGLHGWDYANNDSKPMDDDGHGSHCAGSIAGAENGAGVIGVARRNVRIMAMKFLDASGSGSTADAIDCINYAVARGAKVLSNSWSGGPFEQALFDAITAANNAGCVFVAAAGNDYSDNDSVPVFPAGYNVANVISVAASTRHERIAEFSNWGRTTVDIAAPGEEILSTVLGTAHDWYDGTSMATPHVAGAFGVLYSLRVPTSPTHAISIMLEGTDPSPAYAGRVTSEGRLNLANIVERGLGLDTTPPAAVGDLRAAVIAPTSVSLKLTAVGDDGTSGRATRYDLRFAPSASFNFSTATKVGGGFVPSAAGATDCIGVSGLAAATTYTFQLRVVDNAGNGTLSNPVTVLTAPADPIVFQDGMEAGTNGWTTTQSKNPAWARTSTQKHAGSWSWTDSPAGNYPGNQSSTLVSPVINLTGAGDATLTLWQRYDLESGYDFGRVEASSNGTTWTTLLTQTGTNTTWHQVSANLTAFAGQPSVRVRFRLTSDGSVHRDGWTVDDVLVTKTPPLTNVVTEAFSSAPSALTWMLENDWGIEANNYLSDSPGFQYDANNLSAATRIAAVNLSQAQRAYLSFDLNYDFEVYEGVKVDELCVEMSTDLQRWLPLRRYGGTRTWAREAFDLSRFAGSAQAYVRFVISSDVSVGRNGALIDNLKVDVIPYVSPNGTPDALDDGTFVATEEVLLEVPAEAGLLDNDTDPDDDPLVPTIATQAAHGAVTVNPDGSFTYLPATDYFGTDSFTYRATDSHGAFDTATVFITVTNVNDAPAAASGSKTTNEDVPAAGTLVVSDADSDPLTITVVSGLANGGSFVLDGAAYTYTPAAHWYGTDAVTFEVSDGQAPPATATLTLTVNPVNDAPQALGGSLSTDEDTAAGGTLVATDIELSPLTYSIVAGPTRGTLTSFDAATGAFTYTPALNLHGADSFTFKASETGGGLGSNTATFTLTVMPQNDAPVASDDARTIAIGATLVFDATGNDTDLDGDPLTVLSVDPAANGTTGIDGNGNVTYAPAGTFTGVEQFSYTVSDGNGGFSSAMISVTVAEVNTAPSAQGATIGTNEDVAVSDLLAASDVESDPLTFSIVAGPTRGTLTSFDSSTGAFTYQPGANLNGADSFTFIANDGEDDSDVATITLLVAPVNDAPTPQNDSLTTNAGAAKAINVLTNDGDIDGGALSVTAAGPAAHGTVVIGAGGVLTYTPAAGWSGPDSFSYTVSDGNGGSASASVSVTVNAPLTIASDGFESANFVGGSGWSGAWATAGDNAIVTGGAQEGTRQARLRRGNGRIQRVVNLVGVTGARLRVYLKGTSFESGESAVIRVASNGSSFTAVGTMTSAQANDAWTLYDIDLSGFAMTSSFTIRVEADMGDTNDSVFIDAVRVQGFR